jgi:hypothetical protein
VKTYWMFAIWENSRGAGESLRFHADLAFDPRTLQGVEADEFAANVLRGAGVNADQVSTGTNVAIMVFDTEQECSAQYTATRKKMGMVTVGRDPLAGVGRYGRS